MLLGRAWQFSGFVWFGGFAWLGEGMIPANRLWKEPKRGDEEQKRISTIDVKSVINMANVVAGVSVLAIPFVLQRVRTLTTVLVNSTTEREEKTKSN